MFKAEFPSTVGMVEDLETMEVDGQESKTAQKKYYIDTVNLKVPRKGMEMSSFLNDGMGVYHNLSRCIV